MFYCVLLRSLIFFFFFHWGLQCTLHHFSEWTYWWSHNTIHLKLNCIHRKAWTETLTGFKPVSTSINRSDPTTGIWCIRVQNSHPLELYRSVSFSAMASSIYSRKSSQDHHSCCHRSWSVPYRTDGNVARNFLWGSAHQQSAAFCPFTVAKIGAFPGAATQWMPFSQLLGFPN